MATVEKVIREYRNTDDLLKDYGKEHTCYFCGETNLAVQKCHTEHLGGHGSIFFFVCNDRDACINRVQHSKYNCITGFPGAHCEVVK